MAEVLHQEGHWRAEDQPGGVFCSPRGCGARCTRAAYEEAVRDSDALAARMGAGWYAEVWENLGWHWHVCKGGLTMAEYCVTLTQYGDHYSAAFEIFGLNFKTSAATPEDALGFLLQEVRGVERGIANACSDLSN